MSDRREIILAALKRAGVLTRDRLVDDDIDTAAAQLDGVIRPDATPTDAQADEAVKKGEECKRRLAEKKAKR